MLSVTPHLNFELNVQNLKYVLTAYEQIEQCFAPFTFSGSSPGFFVIFLRILFLYIVLYLLVLVCLCFM